MDPRPGAAPAAAGPVPRSARTALALAVVLIGVYAALDIVVQLLPPHYDPISQAESDLAVGPYGYLMTANFVVRGVLTISFLGGLAGATDVTRRSGVGTALLGVWGVGAFLLAAFPTDVGSTTTVHGDVHLAVAAVAFAGGAFGEWLLSRHLSEEPRLRSLASGAQVVASLAVLFFVVVLCSIGVPYLFHHVFGLVERIFIGLVLLWMLLVAAGLVRREPGTGPSMFPTSGASR